MIHNISVVIIAKNAACSLERTLYSLQSFSEVVVLDNGSTDATKEICARFPNVRVYEELQEYRFNKLRTIANTYTTNDIVFHIDADEVLQIEDETALHTVVPKTLYTIRVREFYRNRALRFGTESDRDIGRLYDKTYYRYREKNIVHENVEDIHGVKGKGIPLHGVYLEHHSIPNYSTMLEKIERYSTLEAQKYPNKIATFPFIRGIAAFVRAYCIKLGVLDGIRGFDMALYRSLVCYYKHKKRREYKKLL